jgi:hypothetical protein
MRSSSWSSLRAGLGAASQTLLEIVDRDTAGLEGRIFQNESVKIGIHGDVLDPLLGQSGLHPGDTLSTIRAGGHDLGDRRIVVRRYVRPAWHGRSPIATRICSCTMSRPVVCSVTVCPTWMRVFTMKAKTPPAQRNSTVPMLG